MDFRAEAERYCREYWDESDPPTSEEVDRIESRLRYAAYRNEVQHLFDAKIRVFANAPCRTSFIHGASKEFRLQDVLDGLTPEERAIVAQIDVMIAITAKRYGIAPQE